MVRKSLLVLLLLMVCLPVVQAQDARVTAIPIPSMLFSYTLSPDGRFAAVFENGVMQNETVYPEYLPVRIYDLASGEEIAALTGQTDYTSDAAFSPDGSLLVSYHTNGYLYVWDTASWELLKRIPAFPGGGLLRWLPGSGSRLAGRITGQPGSVAVWDIESDALTALLTPRYATWQEHKEVEFNRPGGPNPMVTFEPVPDGAHVLVVMSTGEFREWEMATGDSKIWRAVDEERQMFPVREIDFSADGRRLGYFDRTSRQMIVADAASGAVVTAFNTGEAARSGALSPDGETAAWTDGVSVFVAPVAEPEAIMTIPLTTELRVQGQPDLEFLPDGTGLVLGGLTSLENQNALFIIKPEE